jgi:RNA polymerase sigma-70 factor (sigma-E family)
VRKPSVAGNRSGLPGVEEGEGQGWGNAVQDEFERFVETSGRRLLTTAGLLTRERQLAEDLLQTTLLKTWSAWPRITTSPEAYARRTMVNTYVSWWRRRWNAEESTDELPEPPAVQPDREGELDLRSALARLPRRQRAVLVLRYFEDLTERQVAELMGVSVGTVKSQTSKALAKLGIDPALDTETMEVSR